MAGGKNYTERYFLEKLSSKFPGIIFLYNLQPITRVQDEKLLLVRKGRSVESGVVELRQVRLSRASFLVRNFLCLTNNSLCLRPRS